MTKIVLATRNKHKIFELKTLLKLPNVELLTLNDFPNHPPLIEDGATFRENSLKKARTVHQHTKLPALADDSGLEVFYLNKRPGVRSARFAGDNATDEQNNKKLLGEMLGVAPRRRHAQFVAVLSLVGLGPDEFAEGICSGTLGESPRGTNGFGYDPIFIPAGFQKTYAELTAVEKNGISHRSKAAQRMSEILSKRI